MDTAEFQKIIWVCERRPDSLSNGVNRVIETNDPYYICDFIVAFKDRLKKDDIKKFEDAMIEIGDIDHMYEFMYLLSDIGVEGFDKERFEEIIRTSDNPKLMMYSLGFVDGIDKEKMLTALYETKNAKYIEQLSTDIEYSELGIKDRPEYEEKLKEAKEFYYFPKCLEKFKTEDNEIADVVKIVGQVMKLNGNTPSQIRNKAYLINVLANYTQYLKEYHKDKYNTKELEQMSGAVEYLKFAEAITARNEPLHLYEFAASVETEKRKINRRSYTIW